MNFLANFIHSLEELSVDDIGTIYLLVYRIKYILRSVYTKFSNKILIITCLIRHFNVRQ